MYIRTVWENFSNDHQDCLGKTFKQKFKTFQKFPFMLRVAWRTRVSILKFSKNMLLKRKKKVAGGKPQWGSMSFHEKNSWGSKIYIYILPGRSLWLPNICITLLYFRSCCYLTICSTPHIQQHLTFKASIYQSSAQLPYYIVFARKHYIFITPQ